MALHGDSSAAKEILATFGNRHVVMASARKKDDTIEWSFWFIFVANRRKPTVIMLFGNQTEGLYAFAMHDNVLKRFAIQHQN